MKRVIGITVAALFALGFGGETPTIANKGLEIPEATIRQTEKEALAGSGIAAFRLFDYYEIVNVDGMKSLYWATISAENGYPGGMYALGFKLAKERDNNSRIRARYWLEKAKVNGERLADDILKRLDKEPP
jgi:TPR repeat protein